MKIFIVKFLIVILSIMIVDRSLSAVLKKGIDSYYGLDKKAEIVFIGHSRTEQGIDAERVEAFLGMPVAKYAVSGTDIYTNFEMMKHYVEKHRDKKPRIIVLNMDYKYLTEKKDSVNSSALFLPYMNDVVMDKFIYINRCDLLHYVELELSCLLRYSEARRYS